MGQGMRPDFKISRELSYLCRCQTIGGRELVVFGTDIEGRLDAVAPEQSGHLYIELMPVVPASRDNYWLHRITPSLIYYLAAAATMLYAGFGEPVAVSN